MSVRANRLAALLLAPALLAGAPAWTAAAATDASEQTASEGKPNKAVVIMRAVDGVSLRARPDDSAPRYGIVGIGQPVVQLRRNGDWSEVRVDGRVGWIHSAFLEPMRFVGDPQSETVWLQAGQTVSLRSAPGLTSLKIGSVAPTKRLQAMASQKDWTRVRLEENGWLHRHYLIATTDPGLAGQFLRTTEGVNLRAGPGIVNARIDAIGPDQWVEEQGRAGDWVQVRVERRGWVYSRLLEPSSAPHGLTVGSVASADAREVANLAKSSASRAADAPIISPSPPEPATPTTTDKEAAPATDWDMLISAEPRPAASMAPAEGAAEDPAGDKAQRVADENTKQASVLLRAVDGVSLRAQPDNTAPRYSIVGIGRPVEQLKQDGNWIQVRVDGRAGWIRADFLEPLNFVSDTPAAAQWLQTKQAASLRSAPALDGRKIGSVVPTKKLQLMARQENWTRVRFEERGWLHRDYLVAQNESGRTGAYLRTSEGVNLRAGPSVASARIDAIGPDQWVEEQQRAGEWVQVRVERRGWIYSPLLMPSAETHQLAAETEKAMATPDAYSDADTDTKSQDQTDTQDALVNSQPSAKPAVLVPTANEPASTSEAASDSATPVGSTEAPVMVNRDLDTPAPPAPAIVGSSAVNDVSPCVAPPGSAARRPGTPVLRYEPRCDETAVVPPTSDKLNEFPPVPDRWRIVSTLGYPTNLLDPYNGNNPLKGDLPLFGEHNDWFFNLLFISDTVYEPRRFPVPIGGPSTLRPGSIDLFGSGRQTLLNQNFIVEFVLYQGDTVFRPPDWEFRFIPVFNYSDTRVDEVSLLKPSPGFGLTRKEGFVGIQGLFIDKHLRNVSTRFDFDSIRVGIQPFSSDFRGFLFQDNQFGVRLFGTRDNNIYQYNLAWFRRLEKDANSGLNDITERSFGDSLRDDDVFVANVYKQDFPRLGFFSQLTLLYNRNRESGDVFYEDNGFIQRPASIGTERTRDYDVVYLGYNGDGHFGRNNLTTSFYLALGDETNTTFANAPSDIRAWFFAAEFSRDYDWFRPKFSILHGSGDSDPFDDKSEGFDAVFENPQFAGADTSFWIRQGVPLVGGGRVGLSGRNGILNSLRPSKEFGQSNFINPGIWLIGLGADMDLTPELRFSLNANQLWFDDSISVALARNQGNVDKNIGLDVSAAFIYRPFATQNIVLRASGAALIPGQGYKDLFGDEVPFSVLANVVLQY